MDKLAGEERVTGTLKRHLMLTILSCLLHNAPATLESLHSQGEEQFSAFFGELIDERTSELAYGCCSHKKLRSAYELKLFAVALTNVIFMGE